MAIQCTFLVDTSINARSRAWSVMVNPSAWSRMTHGSSRALAWRNTPSRVHSSSHESIKCGSTVQTIRLFFGRWLRSQARLASWSSPSNNIVFMIVVVGVRHVRALCFLLGKDKLAAQVVVGADHAWPLSARENVFGVVHVAVRGVHDQRDAGRRKHMHGGLSGVGCEVLTCGMNAERARFLMYCTEHVGVGARFVALRAVFERRDTAQMRGGQLAQKRAVMFEAWRQGSVQDVVLQGVAHVVGRMELSHKVAERAFLLFVPGAYVGQQCVANVCFVGGHQTTVMRGGARGV